MHPIKVFIIDDDFYVRQATTSLLTKDERTEVIGSAASVLEAYAVLKKSRPDIILLDLDFKHTRESGTEAVLPLKKLLPGVSILIFSASRDEYLILEAMKPELMVTFGKMTLSPRRGPGNPDGAGDASGQFDPGADR